MKNLINIANLFALFVFVIITFLLVRAASGDELINMFIRNNPFVFINAEITKFIIGG